MVRVIFLLICFSSVYAQYSVLDGVYIRGIVPIKKSTPFDERKDFIEVTQTLIRDTNYIFSKPIKIKGFTNVNLQAFLNKWPVKDPERESISSSIAEPKSNLYTSSKIEIIGNPSLGYVQGGTRKYSVQHANFYIKNCEVTNAEYKEFVRYVRDSIILTMLADEEPDRFLHNEGENGHLLKWPKNLEEIIADENYADILQNIYLAEMPERFYKPKQFDSRQFNYKFVNKNGDTNILNIYPDTLSWINDMPFSWNEPMTQMYFWHPVYDNYPV